MLLGYVPRARMVHTRADIPLAICGQAYAPHANRQTTTGGRVFLDRILLRTRNYLERDLAHILVTIQLAQSVAPGIAHCRACTSLCSRSPSE